MPEVGKKPQRLLLISECHRQEWMLRDGGLSSRSTVRLKKLPSAEPTLELTFPGSKFSIFTKFFLSCLRNEESIKAKQL